MQNSALLVFSCICEKKIEQNAKRRVCHQSVSLDRKRNIKRPLTLDFPAGLSSSFLLSYVKQKWSDRGWHHPYIGTPALSAMKRKINNEHCYTSALHISSVYWCVYTTVYMQACMLSSCSEDRRTNNPTEIVLSSCCRKDLSKLTVDYAEHRQNEWMEEMEDNCSTVSESWKLSLIKWKWSA